MKKSSPRPPSNVTSPRSGRGEGPLSNPSTVMKFMAKKAQQDQIAAEMEKAVGAIPDKISPRTP